MNNINKTLFAVSAVISLGFGIQAQAEDRLNGREAANACKQEITENYAGEADIRFSRNPASSMKSGAYTFWINTTEEANGDKSSIKYTCEIKRTGELVSLVREEGRWRI